MPLPRQLTTDGRLKTDPVFVRDGTEIVYAALEAPNLLALMRLKLADGTTERLHPQATTSEFEAAFSPDGRHYAFLQNRGNLNLKLVIRDTRENKDAVFDPGGGFASLRRPGFLAGAGRVVFSIPTANGQAIASVNLQGGDRRDLLTGGLNNWPAVAPDGGRIAFTSNRDGDFDVWVMNADGGAARNLTRRPGLDLRPSWSPDGRRLAFTSNRGGAYGLFVMPAEGGTAVAVPGHGERDDYAAWHPDGRRLVFVAERGGKCDLYLTEVG
jgi:TolB protein